MEQLRRALIHYREVVKRSRAMAQQEQQKAQHVGKHKIGGHSQAFFAKHAERAQRMVICLEKHGLVCLEKGKIVDEHGNLSSR